MKRKLSKTATILIVIGIVLSSAITAFALSEGNLFNKIQELGDKFVADGSVIKIIDQESSKTASENITKAYSLEDLQFLAFTESGKVMNEISIASRSLYDVNRIYPIEHLRKVNDNLIYAVYKINDKEVPESFMYLFFEKYTPDSDSLKDVLKNTEKWYLIDQVFFASNKLETKDFMDIKAGSSYFDVLKIDPMSIKYRPVDVDQITQEVYDFETEKYVTITHTPEPVLSYQSYHYTTDGIICITFERQDANSEYVVKNIGINNNFELSSNAQKGTINVIIDEKDLPNN